MELLRGLLNKVLRMNVKGILINFHCHYHLALLIIVMDITIVMAKSFYLKIKFLGAFFKVFFVNSNYFFIILNFIFNLFSKEIFFLY